MIRRLFAPLRTKGVLLGSKRKRDDLTRTEGVRFEWVETAERRISEYNHVGRLLVQFLFGRLY
jgi:hypothetical protein